MLPTLAMLLSCKIMCTADTSEIKSWSESRAGEGEGGTDGGGGGLEGYGSRLGHWSCLRKHTDLLSLRN